MKAFTILAKRFGAGAALGALVLLGAGPQQAKANDGYIHNFAGGVKVVKRSWDFNKALYRTDPALDLAGILKTQMDDTYSKQRDQAMADIKAETEQQVKKATGQGARDVTPSLAKSGELRAKMSGGKLYLKYVTTQNSVTFYVTTPDGVPGSLDPKFSISFDTEMEIVIPVPAWIRISSAGGTSLLAESATVYVRNAKMDSGNATGDILKGLDSLFGTGKLAYVEQVLNKQTKDKKDATNKSLAQLNAPLQALADKGFTKLTAGLTNDRIVFTLTKQPREVFQVHIDDLNETFKADAQTRALVKTYAKVKIGNSYVDLSNGNARMPMGEVQRHVSVTIEVWRNVTVKAVHFRIERQNGERVAVGDDGSRYPIPDGVPDEQVNRLIPLRTPPPGVKSGLVYSLKLDCDLVSQEISGTVTGKAGQQLHYPTLRDATRGHPGHISPLPAIWFTIKMEGN